MSLSLPGVATSQCEVTSISQFGFWLLLDDREYFVPFADYPDFQSASIRQIYEIERIAPDQLYWPALDVDIDVRSLEYPESFPLAFQKKQSPVF
jgi:hypothetical protein